MEEEDHAGHPLADPGDLQGLQQLVQLLVQDGQAVVAGGEAGAAGRHALLAARRLVRDLLRLSARVVMGEVSSSNQPIISPANRWWYQLSVS